MNNKENINLAQGSEKEEFPRTQYVENLRKYIEQDESRVKELADASGLSEATVRITCTTFAGRDDNILLLHKIMVQSLYEQKVANENKQPTSEYDNNVNSMRTEVLNFIREDTNNLNKLSDYTGLTPEQILLLFKNQEIDADALTLLYYAKDNIEQTKNAEENIPKAM